MARDSWGEPDFVSGHPALDFLNTVADTGRTRGINKLADWAAVRTWAVTAGLLSEAELERFVEAGRGEGADELTALLELRETAYGAMLHLTGRGEDPDAVTTLEQHIRDAIARGNFEIRDRQLGWRPNPETPQRWSDAVALAFEALLRSGDMDRVRQCGRCTWFFIDRGRGRGRRWCDMRTCGNRAKAEAFRKR